MLQTGYVLYFEPTELSVSVYVKEHIVERGDGCSDGNWRVVFRRGDEETVVTHTEIRPLS
jgi:hypothetical protein